MEIELKLSLDPNLASRLARLPPLAGTRPQTRRLHSIYLDTPNRDLMRRGVALRVRRAGRRWLQTLKAEAASVGALTRRPEWEVDLPRGHHDLARFPPEAQALLAGLARQGVDLALVGPVFATDFRRTAWQVVRGETAMEVALDVGEIQAGGQSRPLCEVEIELKAGPREALFDLALELLDPLPLGLEPRSKAARGHALAGAAAMAPVKAGAVELEQGLDAGLAWARLAEAALAQAVANVPGFLGTPEDIEYLHQLRVGLRRLHGIAGLAGRLNRPVPGWDGALKDLMTALNGARDWDVLLHETLPALTPALDSPLSPAFMRHLARRSAQARRAAQAAIADPAFTRLVLLAGRDLQAAAPVGMAMAAWAGPCLQERWEALRKRGKGFEKLDGRQRHRLRIAAKRLRYVADTLAPVFRGGKAFRARLAALQDSLGAQQDQVVAMHLLAGLESRAPQVRFDAGRVVGLLACGLSGAQRGATPVWRALNHARPFWHKD